MKDDEQRRQVELVQGQIEALLGGLEERTGCQVTALQLDRLQVTRISSAAPEYLRSVVVQLGTVPDAGGPEGDAMASPML